MKIPNDKLYEVEGQEEFKDNRITIKRITFLIWATNIKEACEFAENYFGLGPRLIITKCKQVN